MSRFRMLALGCALLVTASLALSDDPLADKEKQQKIEDAFRTKVKLNPFDIYEQPVSKVLEMLRKEHGIDFLIREDEFKAAGISDFKERKSFFQAIDTNGLTVAQFLHVYLASVGARFEPEGERIVIVPAPKWNARAGRFDKEDQAAVILVTFENVIQLREGSNLNDIPLFELLSELSKKHNVTFVINEESFKAAGRPSAREEKPNLATTQVRGLQLHQFLRVVLDSMGATYLIKNNSIEIVPVEYAAKVTKSPLLQADGETGRPRLAEPLVSAIFKEKPLNEAVAQIAKTYDLTATVSPQAGDARTAFASARLLNVPADKALELLALQADLRVVRRGNAYLITSKDQANEIQEEELNKQRQQIELKRLREQKPVPPGAPAIPKP